MELPWWQWPIGTRVWEYSGARRVVMIFEQKVGLVSLFASGRGQRYILGNILRH